MSKEVCTARPCIENPHTNKRCEKCHHYVAHHWRYRYCQECDEDDAKYESGASCDRRRTKATDSSLGVKQPKERKSLAKATPVKAQPSKPIQEILEELIDVGMIFMTKNDVVDKAINGKDSRVEKYAYARERLREEQRTALPKIKQAIDRLIEQRVIEGRIEELKSMQTLWLRLGDPECGLAIDKRISDLTYQKLIKISEEQ